VVVKDIILKNAKKVLVTSGEGGVLLSITPIIVRESISQSQNVIIAMILLSSDFSKAL